MHRMSVYDIFDGLVFVVSSPTLNEIALGSLM